MRWVSTVATVFVLASLAAAAGADKDPGVTRQQADAILNELKQIRILLEKGPRLAVEPAPPALDPMVKASLKVAESPALGSKDAPLTMVEFTDYQCGFCRQFHLSTFAEIRKKYIDTGKLRFVVRDLPLDFHPNAGPAAEAARCAGDQGQFWKMRDTLISNSATLAPNNLVEYAQGLYLDIPKFRACLDGHKYKDAVGAELREAASLHIEGTPSFIIGKTTADGVDGVIMVGAQPLAAFEARLKELDSAK